MSRVLTETTMNFMNSANRVTGQPKGTAAPTLMLWVIIGVATTTLDASDGESDRGDKRPLIGSRPTPDQQLAPLQLKSKLPPGFSTLMTVD